jgi:hypothetical protein
MADTHSDTLGQPIARQAMTPDQPRKTVVVNFDPRPLVPIVFLPGMMGTRLKLKEGGFLWDPDAQIDLFRNYIFKDDGSDSDIQKVAARLNDKAGVLRAFHERNADSEQRSITATFGPDSIDKAQNQALIAQEIQRRTARGWYGLHYASYAPLLDRLSVWGKGMPIQIQGADGKPLMFHNRTHFHPVWAFGYDWRRTPDIIADGSGPYLKGEGFNDFLVQVFADAYAELPRWKWPTKKQVILVTHSLGGLVSRYFSEVVGYGDRIAAIVHLAQPTTGAPLAALRLMMGTQPEADAQLGDLAARGLRWVMGLTSYRYLSAIGPMAGAQTLLASNDYSQNAAKPVAGATDPIDWVRWDDPEKKHLTFLMQKQVDLGRGTEGFPAIYSHPRIGWSAPRFWSRWENHGMSGYTPLSPKHQFTDQWRADATGIKDGSILSGEKPLFGKAAMTKKDQVQEAYDRANAIVTTLRVRHHPNTTAIYSKAAQSISRLTVRLEPVQLKIGSRFVSDAFVDAVDEQFDTVPAYQLKWGFEQSPGDGTVAESSGVALGSVGATALPPVNGEGSDHKNIGNNAQARLQLFQTLTTVAKSIT